MYNDTTTSNNNNYYYYYYYYYYCCSVASPGVRRWRANLRGLGDGSPPTGSRGEIIRIPFVNAYCPFNSSYHHVFSWIFN